MIGSGNMKPHFFTICARNYLARAGALNESLAIHHPDSKLTVFLLDDAGEPSGRPELHTRPIQHAVAADEYNRRRLYYDVTELATSVKPDCFQLMFREGADLVIYIDPDIYVFRS